MRSFIPCQFAVALLLSLAPTKSAASQNTAATASGRREFRRRPHLVQMPDILPNYAKFMGPPPNYDSISKRASKRPSVSKTTMAVSNTGTAASGQRPPPLTETRSVASKPSFTHSPYGHWNPAFQQESANTASGDHSANSHVSAQLSANSPLSATQSSAACQCAECIQALSPVSTAASTCQCAQCKSPSSPLTPSMTPPMITLDREKVAALAQMFPLQTDAGGNPYMTIPPGTRLLQTNDGSIYYHKVDGSVFHMRFANANEQTTVGTAETEQSVQNTEGSAVPASSQSTASLGSAEISDEIQIHTLSRTNWGFQYDDADADQRTLYLLYRRESAQTFVDALVVAAQRSVTETDTAKVAVERVTQFVDLSADGGTQQCAFAILANSAQSKDLLFAAVECIEGHSEAVVTESVYELMRLAFEFVRLGPKA